MRSLDDVRADLDRWLRFYPGACGVFFDEQNSGAGSADCQADLDGYVRTKKGLKLVVTNPGKRCAAGYLTRPAADVCCIFESANGFDALALPERAAKLPSSRFAALAYQVGDVEQMRACIGAAAKTAAYVYVTDGAGASPRGRLPGCWDEEIALVQKANEGIGK
ncbi:MAG TPA: spherulation-specific family 4 protein [Gemmataceae bacterium]|nr:spherulation-specific family 4 protein [Gemmataceae bacterium]